MNKLNSNDIAEIGRYFNPNGQIVTTLPDAKSVRDFSEVAMPNKDGNSFDTYKMIKGQWIKTGSNVTNITQIAQSGGGGSGTAGVTSFNGRTGVVVPILTDYLPTLKANYFLTNNGTSLSWSDIAQNIDGGVASSIYLATQIINGGNA